MEKDVYQTEHQALKDPMKINQNDNMIRENHIDLITETTIVSQDTHNILRTDLADHQAVTITGQNRTTDMTRTDATRTNNDQDQYLSEEKTDNRKTKTMDNKIDLTTETKTTITKGNTHFTSTNVISVKKPMTKT